MTPTAEHERLTRAHPDVIAVTRAHQRRKRGTCASDDRMTDLPCDCRADPDDLAAVWAGRARMAAARRAAGQPLDTVDHLALTRQEHTTP